MAPSDNTPSKIVEQLGALADSIERLLENVRTLHPSANLSSANWRVHFQLVAQVRDQYLRGTAIVKRPDVQRLAAAHPDEFRPVLRRFADVGRNVVETLRQLVNEDAEPS
jgi:hypothetical protein